MVDCIIETSTLCYFGVTSVVNPLACTQCRSVFSPWGWTEKASWIMECDLLQGLFFICFKKVFFLLCLTSRL